MFKKRKRKGGKKERKKTEKGNKNVNFFATHTPPRDSLTIEDNKTIAQRK